MKKLLCIALVIGCSLPALAQKNSDAAFFKTLSTQRSIDPVVRKASIGISKNYLIADSILYFTRTLEQAVLSGKSGGTIKPQLVKTAMKQYPGDDYRAMSNRLRLYATEGKKGL